MGCGDARGTGAPATAVCTLAIRVGLRARGVVSTAPRWLPPTIFFLVATPIVRGLRAGEAILAHPIALLLRATFLALLATGWVSLLRDQLPCFLGVPNCD
jgi:hypothetical protein